MRIGRLYLARDRRDGAISSEPWPMHNVVRYRRISRRWWLGWGSS